MSTTEAVSHPASSRMDGSCTDAATDRSVETPIVPHSTISGRALVAIIAIMAFLASLTTGLVTLVRTAANEWQADVAREVTIQIRGTSGRDLEKDVEKTVTIARAFPGVAEVKPYSKQETTRLLEPWLGSGFELDALPVPRIIVVRTANRTTPSLNHLRASIEAQVPGATLDDHRGFVDRMRAMANAALFGGVAVLLLVLAATVLSVTFATRAAMATNRPVIEVLHLIGAKDNFIAAHFQQHFLHLGLKGGLLGGGMAIFLFACADFASGWFLGTAAGDQFAAMFGTFSIGAIGYLAVLAQVAMVAGVTALTSRRTVNRTIETVQ
jgi:cell division transport system permease protein